MRTCDRQACGTLAAQLLTLAFLAFIANPAMAMTWQQEVMADNPLSWWQLNEPAGSQVFVDSGSVGLDLNAITAGDGSGADFDEDLDVDGTDFLAWQRGNGIMSGATHGQGDANGDEIVDADDLAIWIDDYGNVEGIAAGLPSLPGIGSAIDTMLGHLEAFDDVKGGQLAISTRQGSTAISNFTYEAWVKVTTTEATFGNIGGNTVNANPDGGPVVPNENGVWDQYGTRLAVSTDLNRFAAGLTGIRLEDENGTELVDNGTAQGQPTKDLHFPGDDFGAPEDQRLSVEADQWYYVVAQWSEAGFNAFNVPSAGFIGHVYWQDDQGVIHERHRDHGTNFDFGQIRLPDVGLGLLGFAIGAQGISGANNFEGQISEFAVYGEVLTEERLEAHFNAVIPLPSIGLSTAVPEPSAMALLFAGSFMFGLGRRTATCP